MRQETLDEMVGFLDEMEGQMEQDCATSRRHGRTTTMIMRTGLLLVVVLAVAAGLMLYQLAQGMQQNLDAASSMTAGFTDIGNSMLEITQDVVAMNQSVQSLRLIDHDVHAMAGAMQQMDDGFKGLSGDMKLMAGHMYHFDATLADMEGQMMVLSNDVRAMGGSVNRMAKPMRIMNAFMPW